MTMRRNLPPIRSLRSDRAWFAIGARAPRTAPSTISLHVWSRSGGKKQVQEILEAIKSVLHYRPLALPDHHLVNLRYELSEARLDPDGDTFHGIVRYRAMTEPAQAAAA
jgi:hypothetical protein